MNRTRVLTVALLPAVLIGSAACSSDTSHSSSPVRATPTGAAASSTPVASSTVTGAAGTPVSSSAASTSSEPTGRTTAVSTTCSTANLRITATENTPAGGNFSVFVRMTNTGSASCTTYGYPGIAVLDAAGGQQFQAVRTLSGYSGGAHGAGPKHITLSRGSTATALLEGANHSQPGGKDCPADHAVLITPPNTKKSVRRAVEVYVCKAPDIHPLVLGTTGTG